MSIAYIYASARISIIINRTGAKKTRPISRLYNLYGPPCYVRRRNIIDTAEIIHRLSFVALCDVVLLLLLWSSEE